MKLLKQLSVGLLAAACVSTASATPAPAIIHAVGSTAFRAGATIAIIDMLAGTTVADNPSFPGTGQYNYITTPGTTTVYGATSGNPMTGASLDIFANGYIGGTDPNPGHDVAATIIVEVSWTGSLAGVVDLTAQASTAPFYNETNSTVITTVNANTIATIPGPTAYATPANLTTTGTTQTVTDIELAMSDSVNTTISKELSTGAALLPQGTGAGQYNYPAGNGFSAGQQHVGPYGTVAALATACSGANIIDAGTTAGTGTVAIVPFQWVVGNMNGVNGATGHTSPYGDGSTFTIPTNITQQLARQLIGGAVSQGLFTGLSTAADFGNWFMFLGRNEDSGTRIGYLMEAQFGVTANPKQWTPSFTNAANTTLYPVTPLNTEPMIQWGALGHSGFSSGGNISGPLSTLNNGNVFMDPAKKPSADYANGYFISSLGIPDAYNAIKSNTSGGHNLTYNGVAFNPANVENGSYSMWEYEHCYRLGNASTAVATAVDTVADIITASDADTIYLASAGSSGWVSHSENESTGMYAGITDMNNNVQWPVGVKNDEWVQVSRSTTEGGPISTNY